MNDPTALVDLSQQWKISYKRQPKCFFVRFYLLQRLIHVVLMKQTEDDDTLPQAGATPHPILSEPERWVDLHGDYLFKFALTRLRDRAKAEDAVQETFLAALKFGKTFQGRSAEKSWLAGILKKKSMTISGSQAARLRSPIWNFTMTRKTTFLLRAAGFTNLARRNGRITARTWITRCFGKRIAGV